MHDTALDSSRHVISLFSTSLFSLLYSFPLRINRAFPRNKDYTATTVQNWFWFSLRHTSLRLVWLSRKLPHNDWRRYFHNCNSRNVRSYEAIFVKLTICSISPEVISGERNFVCDVLLTSLPCSATQFAWYWKRISTQLSVRHFRWLQSISVLFTLC
jgi:hypothetical protein